MLHLTIARMRIVHRETISTNHQIIRANVIHKVNVVTMETPIHDPRLSL